MGRKLLMTEVSKKKLVHELAIRNLTLTEASEACGYSSYYISGCIKQSAKEFGKGTDRLRISTSMAMLLESKFSISLKSIEYDEDDITEQKSFEFDIGKFMDSYMVMAQAITWYATYQGVKAALNGDELPKSVIETVTGFIHDVAKGAKK